MLLNKLDNLEKKVLNFLNVNLNINLTGKEIKRNKNKFKFKKYLKYRIKFIKLHKI